MATRRGSNRLRLVTPELDMDMLVDLSRSGLDEEDVRQLQLQYCEKAPDGIAPSARGYVIPYFDLNGKTTGFYRYRYLEDTRTGFEKLSGKKQRRYTQPVDTSPQVYWPPYIVWSDFADGIEDVIITEGEKKAARVTKGGIPTLGLGGVWSFQNAVRNETLIPALTQFNWEGRLTSIIYDSDAADKIQIQQAEYRLARRLVGLGAKVRIVRLPHSENGDKRGLDDYVQAFGIDALKDACNETEPFQESEALHQLNAEVTYVKDPGLVYVLDSGQLVEPTAFKTHRYADRHYTRAVTVGQTTKLVERDTATDWLKWPGRSAVSRLEFEPGEGSITERGALNLWRGWAYEPVEGDVDPWSTLLDHIFYGYPEPRKWAEQWMAFPFQHPGTKHRNALVVWGRRKGTGKSLIGYTLGDLYGDAFSEIGDDQIEKSDFNSWARNKQFIMGDDITGNNNRRVANDLKRMVTRETLEINIKHVPQYFTRDCINYYFTSNSPDAFLLDEDDRRFFVHETSRDPLPDRFYEKFNTWRKTVAGRRALMYHFVNNVDCSGFSPTARAPMTEAKKDMIAMTRTDLEQWLMGLRDDPDAFCRKFGNSDLVTISEMMNAYDPQDRHRVTSVTFAKKLKEVGIDRADPTDKPPGAQFRVGPHGELVRFYVLRNPLRWAKVKSDEMREYYEKCRRMKPVDVKKF